MTPLTGRALSCGVLLGLAAPAFAQDVAVLGSATDPFFTSDVVNTAMPRAFKRYRQIDGPPGERKLTHGFRAYMFRELVRGGYDRTSARGIVRWAAALGAHNLLLRGG